MAILPMKHISMIGLKKDRRAVLDVLQRCGTVQINDINRKDNAFYKYDVSSEKLLLEKQAAVVQEALEILDRHVPEKKPMLNVLNGKQELSRKRYEKLDGEQEEILETAKHIRELSDTISEYRAGMEKLQVQMDSLVPWSSLDLPLQFRGTKSVAAFIGSLTGEMSREELLASLFDRLPAVDAVHLEIVSSTREQVCIVLLCLRRDAGPVENALRSMGFAYPSASVPTLPIRQMQEWKEKKDRLEKARDTAEEEIRDLSGQRDSLKGMLDCYAIRKEKADVAGRLLQSRHAFFLEGYIPARKADTAAAILNEQFDLLVEYEDPSGDADVPILLENNKFAEPVEGVLRSFSLPGKGEIDPTFLMAIFYYILFGLMLSDAGYGLLMVLGCGFCLRKYKNMEPGMQKTLRMFFFCGISTTFWGAMFGSWFGDVTKIVSTTFFHRTVSVPPLWFEPVNDPMQMLVFSMAVGILHLFTGLGAKMYQSIKAKQYKDAVYDVVFWYLLVGGLVVVLLSSSQFAGMFGLNFVLPSVVGKAAGRIAAMAAVGIILTAGRESRNWFKRILKGLYGLYNVTGYLSDILSYSRLLALGLATGVIATVINQMGAMFGDSVMGAVLFAVVFLIGHALNMAINLLGAYVHTNRLSFVEFFGKFYEGGGKEFTPFAVHTKYFEIKEET